MLPIRSSCPSSRTRRSFDLELQRQLRDLVEEDGRAVRQLEAPGLAGQGPGVGALLAPEQLRLDQGRGQRRAVELDHGPVLAPAPAMEEVGEQLLPGARLAQQQDGGIGRRDVLHLAQHPLQGRRVADDLARLRLGRLAEIGVLGLELLLQARDVVQRAPERLLAPLARQGIGEDVRHELQALHEHVRPLALRRERAEGERPEDPAGGGQGKDQVGLLLDGAEGVLVARGRGGQLLERREAHDPAPEQRLMHPREVLLRKEPGMRGEARHGPGVRDDQVGLRLRPLQEGAAVQPQRLDDAPLGLFDHPVHLVGRHVDEAGREVGEERLEAQPLLQFRPQGLFRVGHRAFSLMASVRSRVARAGGPSRLVSQHAGQERPPGSPRRRDTA